MSRAADEESIKFSLSIWLADIPIPPFRSRCQGVSKLSVSWFLPFLLFSQIGPLATPSNLGSCECCFLLFWFSSKMPFLICPGSDYTSDPLTIETRCFLSSRAFFSVPFVFHVYMCARYGTDDRQTGSSSSFRCFFKDVVG